ncbi:MAG: hypothetical protein QOG65_3037, partial [Actinomycetota bacterium]|nr:hypothetical protein [Actinomycetota bacterium]
RVDLTNASTVALEPRVWNHVSRAISELSSY